ncbi:hypothetical protein [Zavarzinella formosa]|uniref:hypothetical protein n=1 Tax=Zavarzinella formosa TaxID=360055 RepID=UPI00035DEEFC|nr:hypothetical protein [Zavarzinella formosa]
MQNDARLKAARKVRYQSNLEKFREEKKAYYRKNVAKKRLYDVEYRAANKDRIRDCKRVWEEKNRDNSIVRVKRNLRRRLGHVIRRENKCSSMLDLLSCSAEDFVKHIESQFETGMSWENYGSFGWHIDHIMPCHSFDLTKPDQQQACFHYTNLRPLWWRENISRRRIHEDEN